jgi:hypothetical protein
MPPAKSKGKDGQIVLHLCVEKAKDLPKVDFLGKIDAYVVLQLSSSHRVMRTKIIDCNYEPEWDQTFLITVGSAKRDVLHIRVRDNDMVLRDQNVSELKIALKELQYGCVHEAWYDLTPFRGFKKGGKIFLKLQLAPEDSIPFAVVGDAAPAEPAAGAAPGMVVQPAMTSEFMPFTPVPIYIGYAQAGPRAV